MKKIIVSQRIDYFSTRNELREGVDARLILFLRELGYLPYIISNFLGDGCKDWITELEPTGIVLSGGNDIGQYLERDQTEKSLLDYATQKTLPVIGICRGMQYINHYQGGSLQPISNHVACRHAIRGEWAAQWNITEVNSYHNHSIDQLGKDLQSIALADGVIEALRHEHYPWLGIMWHPEREGEFKDYDQTIFKEHLGL